MRAAAPGETSITVEFKLVVDEACIRESYDTYAADCEWYRTHGEEGYGDNGYGLNVPEPYEKYRADWIDGIVGEIEGHSAYSWRLEGVAVGEERWAT